jgi:hypothetical protein
MKQRHYSYCLGVAVYAKKKKLSYRRRKIIKGPFGLREAKF